MQDFAELKDKPNSRIPDFSRLLKLNPRSKVKSPSHEVEMVNARGAMATITANDQPRIRKFTHESIPGNYQKHRSHLAATYQKILSFQPYLSTHHHVVRRSVEVTKSSEIL